MKRLPLVTIALALILAITSCTLSVSSLSTPAPTSTSKGSSPPTHTSTVTPSSPPTPATAVSPELVRHWEFSNWSELFESTPVTVVKFLKSSEGIYDKDPYMGKPFVTFNLAVEGLPKDKVYDCWVKTVLTGKPTKPSLTGLKIDDSGYVVQGSSRVALGAVAYGKGEAMEVSLVTEDKTIIGYGIVIPYPIENRVGQCHVWVQCLVAGRNMFAIWGEGFEPNGDIDVNGNSEGEVIKLREKADSNGLLGPLVVLPAVIGKTSGTAIYTFVVKAGALPVSFDWVSPTP